MIANGTGRGIAITTESVDAASPTGGLYVDVSIRSENIGIAGDVVRALLVFKCPVILRSFDLLEIRDASASRGCAAAAIKLLDNRCSHNEDKRQTHHDVNGCDASRFFQTG